MSKHAKVPDVKVAVSISGDSVAIFSFWKVEFSPQEWEVGVALADEATRKAVRACLLACVAELSANGWTYLPGLFETSSGERDEPQPF